MAEVPQLTRDEHLRLECLTRALANTMIGTSPDIILNMARRFESFVKGNDKKDGLE